MKGVGCEDVWFRDGGGLRHGYHGKKQDVSVGASTSTPDRWWDVAKKMLNKVPEVTIYFWIIKVLCTTVGETAADFLNVNLGLQR